MNITMLDLGHHLSSRASAIAARDLIGGALSRSEDIRLDFKGVETATQSFLDELIGTHIRRIGPQVVGRLTVANCSRGIVSVLEFVVSYSVSHLHHPQAAAEIEQPQFAI